LMPFNNEKLVREIANFPCPVIVGVGHHKDEPLVTFVADVSVSTPTAAANLLNQSWEEARLLLEKHKSHIISAYSQALSDTNSLMIRVIDNIRSAGALIVQRYTKIKNELLVSMHNFRNALLNVRTKLDDSQDRYFSALKTMLASARQKLEHSEKVISLSNPERQLKLGYSIARLADKVVRSVKNVKVGDKVDIRVVDGIINSEVKNIK